MLAQYELRNSDGLPILREKSKIEYSGTCNAPHEIAELINSVYDSFTLPEEHVWAIALNTRLKPIGIFEVSHGIADAAYISPREIMIRLLLCGAIRFALAHNHPSGDTSPSTEDLEITKVLKNAGELLRVNIVDHVIVAGSQYYSFHENRVI